MDFKVTAGISPSCTNELWIPPSKSHSMRAILLASMADGISNLSQVLPSPDREAMVCACRLFGANIEVLENNQLIIKGVAGKPQPIQDIIDVGNSGQVLRFIGAMAALLPTYTVLTGDLSIRTKRPIQPLLQGLQSLGAWAVSALDNGFAPLVIRGPIKSGTVVMDGQDSQPVSAMLMMSAFLPGITYIKVNEPGECPWVDLTLNWLQRLGVEVSHNNYTNYMVSGGSKIQGFNYQVPGDYSSAAFPLVASLLTRKSCVLHGLDPDDVQGDKKIIEILQLMGANLIWNKETDALHIEPTDRFYGCEISVNDVIDAVPILAVMACACEGETVLKGARIARSKESDRLHAITLELTKMGARIQEFEDGLVINNSKLFAANLYSHNDHRIAMALSVAGLIADGTTVVTAVDCVEKSYPRYANAMQSLGFLVQEIDSLCGF